MGSGLAGQNGTKSCHLQCIQNQTAQLYEELAVCMALAWWDLVCFAPSKPVLCLDQAMPLYTR